MHNGFIARWIDTAGFWMAVFSLAGLVALMVAGERVEQRMTKRMQRWSSVTEQTTTSQNEVSHQTDSQPEPVSYSLAMLKWILAFGVAGGGIWSIVSIGRRLEAS